MADDGMVVGTVTITRVLTDDGFRYDVEAADGEGDDLDFDETLLILERARFTLGLHEMAAELGIDVEDMP